ncbi:hypothetical protein DYB25_007960 [Aphanomyces astaci]|uniref:Major facilitator superfamily (MFS) profile domain-containing protein n=4 Tax=Aphanomyces astaci TaxID=112090 RepID=A0A397CAP8_APHAT|nr:hypothetical protein DYB25_007960 [Aphanomyces astaci]RHY42815.1 hypothetical protein DYB38_006165 [Aphanomyces astaci]
MLSKLWTYTRDAEHNVKLSYLFTITFWSCRSIIFQQVLSGYVYVLTQSNEPVGMVKGIQGVVQMISAVPGGWACDHFRRDTILKISSVLGIFCALLSVVAFYMGHLMMIYVAFGFWGVFSALQGPALEALFADSIPNGERSFPITIKHMLMNTAMVAGPGLCIVFFLIYGDSWSLEGLQNVLIIGTVIGVPPLVLLFFFNDDLAYENYTKSSLEKPRALSFVDEDGVLEFAVADDDVDANPRASEASKLLVGSPVAAISDSTSPSSAAPPTSLLAANTFLCFGPRHVPYLLFLADFVICNGAGMTVSFFPVFFQNDYGLTPSQVNILYFVQPLLIVVLSYITQRLSTRTGTIETVVVTRIFSTLCLGAMAFVTPLSLEIGLFLLRGFMRCSEPLRTSLMMDYVPQHLRGRWNSLEGLTQFTYSGSAVVGGYLIERQGYRLCFFITAVIYVVGVAIECLLVPIIRNHHRQLQAKSAVVKLVAA